MAQTALARPLEQVFLSPPPPRFTAAGADVGWKNNLSLADGEAWAGGTAVELLPGVEGPPAPLVGALGGWGPQVGGETLRSRLGPQRGWGASAPQELDPAWGV